MPHDRSGAPRRAGARRVGLPYLGYVVANIPSSIVVTRVGAPVWLALLMLCWGVVSACTAAVRTRAQFYAIRVLLGITEAGCFPGAPAHPPPGPRLPRRPVRVPAELLRVLPASGFPLQVWLVSLT